MQHDFILLDRSGSMKTLWEEALGAVNSYVKKLAEDKIDTGVTLAVFDSPSQGGTMDFQTIRNRIIPSTWHEVATTEVEPRGFTPLNDATCQIVNLAKAGNYDKVAIIIMTDGAENASKEFTVTQAKLLLDQCRARGWQVIFLGANFDNAAQAASYGNSMRSTVQVARGNLQAATMSVNSARADYAATGATMEFTDEEKRRLAEKK